MATGRSRASASASGARALALRVIRRVTEDGAYSNLALSGELGRSRLDARDRRFAADLVYGTLRRRLCLDWVLAGAATRPLEAVDPAARAVLRLGAYQILFSRVPPHAAVSETVELASPRHRGFANAILRRVAGTPWDPPRGEDDRAISLRTGLSAWAVAELQRLLPSDQVEPAAAALAASAHLSLRVNRCRATAQRLGRRLAAAGHEVQRGLHHPEVLRIPSTAPALLPGYREGWFAVQDEASVVVAEALGAEPGERILDACAGPGGKAAHLACLVGPDGLAVGADVRLGRALRVRSTADRLGVPIRVLAQDAARPALREGFDAVLVDAPCSGLGAARRRPELLWRPSKASLAGLARAQVAILVGSAGLVRPGGRLVYSVCTFPRAETDAAVRAFLAKCPGFEPAAVPGPDGPATSHRLWPHRHGTDAMFFAGFRRLR